MGINIEVICTYVNLAMLMLFCVTWTQFMVGVHFSPT